MDPRKRLTAYLRRAGLSQASFARLTGMTAPFLSMVISGKRLPGRDASLNIELATGGRVKATSWSKIDPRKAA